jgi:hypothetical protein
MTATPAKARDARRIDYLPLAALKENPRNPRTHDVSLIGASVDRFGYLEPIVRDERTGLIVSGHGRTRVLREMRERGDTPPEGCRAAPDGGDWLVPVVVGWASRTDNEAAAALIALNRTTELGGWVDDTLLELLDELDATGDDGLAGVGFSDEDRAVLQRLRDATGVFDDDYDVDEALDELGNDNLEAFKKVLVNCADEEAYDRLVAFIASEAKGFTRLGTTSFWYGAPKPTSPEPQLVAGSFDAPAG